MAPAEKKEWMNKIIMAIITILSSLIIFSWTFKKETNYSETKELKNQVNQLELKKLGKTEFEIKCTAIEADFENHRVEMKNDFKDIIEDIKESQIRMENNSIANQKEMNDKLDRALGLKYIKENR
jgi:hypothetical protein